MDWNLSLDKNCNLQWFFTLMTKIKQKMWDASNNQHQSNLVSFKYNPFCVNLIKQSVTNGSNSYQEWIGPLKSQADGALFSHEENTFLFVLEWSARKLKLRNNPLLLMLLATGLSQTLKEKMHSPQCKENRAKYPSISDKVHLFWTEDKSQTQKSILDIKLQIREFWLHNSQCWWVGKANCWARLWLSCIALYSLMHVTITRWIRLHFNQAY